MDYNETVARLTIKVASILSGKGISADTGAVFDWLYAKGVHRDDDAAALASEYEGK